MTDNRDENPEEISANRGNTVPSGNPSDSASLDNTSSTNSDSLSELESALESAEVITEIEHTPRRRAKRAPKSVSSTKVVAVAEKTPRKTSPKAAPVRALARHTTHKQRNRFISALKFFGAAVAVTALSVTSVAAYTVLNLTSNITVVDLPESLEGGDIPTIGAMEGGAINILVVGSDIREGDSSSARLNDVTMLLHISADRTHATAVTFPRDLIIPHPRCTDPTGGSFSAMSAQPINVALSRGGLGCVVQTVENLTGISIPYAMEVTFSGVIHMTRAIGGVDVCVESPIRDADSHLYLEPGTHTIEGPTALAFLRTRKMVGDGSDLGRIGLQQSFLSSMIRKVTSGDTLTDMNKLYSIATVATQNLTLSRSLGGLDAMISLALIARDLDLSKVSFVTYPGSTGSLEHPGKVIPIKSQADDLFTKIKADVPIIPQAGNTGSGTNVVESGSSGQGNVGNSVRGQTADTVTCAVGR